MELRYEVSYRPMLYQSEWYVPNNPKDMVSCETASHLAVDHAPQHDVDSLADERKGDEGDIPMLVQSNVDVSPMQGSTIPRATSETVVTRPFSPADSHIQGELAESSTQISSTKQSQTVTRDTAAHAAGKRETHENCVAPGVLPSWFPSSANLELPLWFFCGDLEAPSMMAVSLTGLDTNICLNEQLTRNH